MDNMEGASYYFSDVFLVKYPSIQWRNWKLIVSYCIATFRRHILRSINKFEIVQIKILHQSDCVHGPGKLQADSCEGEKQTNWADKVSADYLW